MSTQPPVVGDNLTYDCNPAQPTLDGTSWNLAGGSATFTLRRPDGTTFTASASVAASQPSYTDLASPSILTVSGNYEFWFVAIDASGVRKTIGPRILTVGSAP